MNNEQTSLWDSVSTDEKPQFDAIKFEINIPQTVTFPNDFVRPEEYPSQFKDGELFCVFPVIVSGESKSLATSSYTLLRELKKHEPLANKTLTIVKKFSKDGKQFFEVLNSAEGISAQA